MRTLGELLTLAGLVLCAVGLVGYVIAIQNGYDGGGSDHWTWNPIRLGLLSLVLGAVPIMLTWKRNSKP